MQIKMFHSSASVDVMTSWLESWHLRQLHVTCDMSANHGSFARAANPDSWDAASRVGFFTSCDSASTFWCRHSAILLLSNTSTASSNPRPYINHPHRQNVPPYSSLRSSARHRRHLVLWLWRCSKPWHCRIFEWWFVWNHHCAYRGFFNCWIGHTCVLCK